MTEGLDKIKTMKSDVKAKLDVMKKEASSIFIEAIKELFIQHPTIESARWYQYTPYFNDGDSCNFYANVDEIDVRVVDNDFNADDEELSGGYDWNNISFEDGSEQDKFAGKISNILSILGDDILLSLFGDHALVIVSAPGVITTEEYEHD